MLEVSLYFSRTALPLKTFKLLMLSLETYLTCPSQLLTKDIWQSLSMALIETTQTSTKIMCSILTIFLHTTTHCGLEIGTLCWIKKRTRRIIRVNITKKQRVV